jgi:hypothetical protein
MKMVLSKHEGTERVEREIDKYAKVRVYLRGDDNREFAVEIGPSEMGDDHVQIRALDRQLVIRPSVSNTVSVTVEDWLP